MTTLIAAQLLALALLLVISAFFSSSETALFSLNPLQVRRMTNNHPRAGQRVESMLQSPRSLLSTILIGNTVVNIATASTGFAVARQVYPAYAEELSIVVVTLLLLVLGEVGPKRIALLWPERVAALYAPTLQALIKILYPARLLLEKITNRLENYFIPTTTALTEDELHTVVDVSEEEGVLRLDESEMVKSIIRLQSLRAKDVMTPRVDIIGLDLTEDASTYLKTARKANVRRLLLYRDQLDYVEGFVDVRSFLLDAEHQIAPARIAPLYIPETSPLDNVLTQLQEAQRRIAVVVDEYGGTAGVITQGDVLEEIVGELDVETSSTPLFEELGPNRWLADGTISLEAINHRIRVQLEAEGSDRLAGWIAAQTERMPRPGDVVEADGCRAIVQQMRQHRITRVLIKKLEDNGS